ncbi:MAG: plasmid recombination protein, partial [Lachnospiraceae bacterium]|nr:plasmid recombination protein [Lachnospiraceae bacterium]
QHLAELDAEMRKNSKNNRGLRKDAVVMIATIIQPPKEFLETLNKAQRIQFMKDCREILTELVGSERMKSSIVHYDEQSEHLHAFWEPMTDDGRLCAKEVVNLKFYNKLNREFPEKLRARGWKDIDDCFAFDQAVYDAMTEEEKKEFWEKKKYS